VAPGDSVDGIGIVRYPDSVSGQLLSKSYRPRTGSRGRFIQVRDPLGQPLGPVDGRLPEALAGRGVERGEDLAAPAVEHGQPLTGGAGLADSRGQGVERADPARRQAEADAEPAGAGDPDPQAGEGAGSEADREQVDGPPAASGRGRALNLLQQPRRVQGPPGRGQPQPRLIQYLAVAPGAGDGVDRRGVEADDYQGCATPSP
jgi:hypothetical protein